MPLTAAAPLDLVEELRLRRWARLNYAPSSERDPQWHPVVHEEMDRKESELASAIEESLGDRYVPLAPQPGVHAAHRPSPPRFLATPRQSQELHYT